MKEQDGDYQKIIFNRETLYLKFLFASNFAAEASLWIEDRTCELVISNEIFVKVNIPVEQIINIPKNEKHSFNIPIRHIFKHSLANSKSKNIIFVFLSHYEVKVKNIILNNLELSDINSFQHKESISSYKETQMNEDFFTCFDTNESKTEASIDISNTKIKKNKIVLYQKYKTQYVVNDFYRLNISDYQSKTLGSFVVDYVSLNSFIKNLINIKPNNIIFTINNKYIYFECKGIEPSEVILEGKLIQREKSINQDCIIDFKSFKKLNCLSKIGKGDGKNKKKIFDNILFKISLNEYDEPNGLLISTPITVYYHEYFIFLPFTIKE